MCIHHKLGCPEKRQIRTSQILPKNNSGTIYHGVLTLILHGLTVATRHSDLITFKPRNDKARFSDNAFCFTDASGKCCHRSVTNFSKNPQKICFPEKTQKSRIKIKNSHKFNQSINTVEPELLQQIETRDRHSTRNSRAI